MKQHLRTIGKALLTAAVMALLAVGVLGQHPDHSSTNKAKASTGILLLAHGGSAGWNSQVLKLADEVNKEMPVEVAFGMATKRTIQESIDKLAARGVKEILAVPLFISSYSSVITSTEYLLGLRKDAPADLARFAKMDHSAEMNHSDHAMMSMNASFNPLTPVVSPVPLRMTQALNRHPLVGEILLDRARSVSQEPSREVVVLVAHGPVPDEDNARWLSEDRKSVV